ncbi:hypothetical protein BDV93DRAFT_563196 [Ceratobasidium sp. AG-I]|nr:hypothetical protein BDV93DRAFT_563196 [Ceratobasidium sp. AG-I]
MVNQSGFVQDQRVIVIATLYIVETGGAPERFIPVFQKFLRGVHTEPGMNHFTVSVNKDFTEYGIYEEYKDLDSFKAHRDSPHSEEFNRIAKDPDNPLFRPEKQPAVSNYTPFRPIS